MAEARWWRPQPELTSRQAYDEIHRRRLARGIDKPPPIIVESDPCELGCPAGTLYRVVSGPTLEGSLICRECGTVYRRDTP